MERRPRMRINQLLPVQQRKNRTLQQTDDVELGEERESDHDTDDDRACNPEQPPAQLLQMIQERHLLARSFAHTAPSLLLDRLQTLVGEGSLVRAWEALDD